MLSLLDFAMKKIHYNKLIRDKIPERIAAAGATGKYKILSKKTFIKKLIAKVEEEASGMQKAKSKKELISEIADVMDVLDEIKKNFKISKGQVILAQKENFKKKGGFKKRIFLYWSSDDGYKTNEKRYDRHIKNKQA